MATTNIKDEENDEIFEVGPRRNGRGNANVDLRLTQRAKFSQPSRLIDSLDLTEQFCPSLFRPNFLNIPTRLCRFC